MTWTEPWRSGLLRKSLLQPRNIPLALMFGVGLLLASVGRNAYADPGAPTITQQPQGRSVLEGSNFTFSVTASGTAPLSYQWRFNGTNLASATSAQLAFTPVALSNAGLYQVVVSNSVGSVTSMVAQLVVRSTNDPVYASPDGGWSYIYAGNATASSLTAALDGTWNHSNGDDSWSGDGRGVGNGLAGGLSTSNGVATIEDAVSPGSSGFDNRRYYFTHNINNDAAVTNANTLLNDGVTLSFRARLTPPTDPLVELTNAPNGFVNVSDGKGMFGIRQSGSSGMIVSFSLNKAVEDTSTTVNFTNASAGLHMNNLNGDVRSAFVDPGEGGTINLLSLDPAAFHEFWIQIQDNGASLGTHRVSIYVDGSVTPTVFNVTAGTGSEGVSGQPTNYLALGLPSSAQRGAVDVDFFSYKAGIIAPVGQEAPPGIVLQPISRTLAEGETASFTVGVTGTPPFLYQWFKRGTAIANATNSSYTTPPASPSDDAADFMAIVSNVNGSASSSSATLTVISDTQPPTVVSAGSFDGARIGLCFSERVTAASATNLTNYVINGGAVSLGSATLRTNDGGASVILTVSGLGVAAGTPFVVTASNIRDVSASGNIGGGSVTGIVLALTPVDVGTVGVDPLVAGVSFACASNAFEILAGGSDIGGLTDGFQFVYQRRSGDFDVSVRVARLDAANRLSKAALLAREDLSAGSRNVNVFVTPASVLAADGSGLGTNVIEADYRATVGGASAEWPGGAKQSGIPYPNAWIRLLRLGDSFTSFYGTNGVDWTQLGQMTAVYPAEMYIGLGVTAHTNAAGRSTTALLQNFAFAPSPEIVAQPQSLIVTNGDSASFSVVATGIGVLRYQWRLNGTNITDATNTIYSIASAHAADAGAYDVLVRNGGGVTASAVAVLTVRLFDFGDAPDGYKTLRASNGARHVVVPGVYLGAGIDVDLDGLPGSTALGDDSSGSDDEDGVRFTTALLAGQVASVEVVASTNGLLNAWIDWNGNGVFAEAGEQVFTNRSLAAGTNLLQFVVSRQATTAPTYARFRFSTSAGLSFDGPAADGEVEDYSVTVTPVADMAVAVSSVNAVAVGSNLTFTVLVTNGGPSTASSVSLTNQLQGLVTYVSITSSRGSCSRTGNTISCALGQMLDSEIATVAITVVPQQSGTISNFVQAVAPETDLVSANNSTSSIVAVELSPAITTQPVSQTITQGSSATFTAAANGTAPLFYQWRKNGTPLAGQQQLTLNITNATAADEADYTIQVSNRVGSVLSQIAHLTVLVPPSITQHPQSTTNYAGGSLLLSVIATGTEPLRYQWFYNTNNLLSAATNASLLLTNTLKTQSGSYHVSVTNTAGRATSAVARVVFLEADFGDAPDSYGTTLASNGARHLLVPGIRLGTTNDYESDGHPHSAALGDDLLGSADEDGVAFIGNLYPGQSTIVRVVVSTNGLLNGWLDLQANGNWTDPGDRVFSNVSVSAGTNLLTMAVPANASASNTFARFRFSTTAAPTPFGEALDGEVEDYAVTIRGASDLALGANPMPGALAVDLDLTYTLHITNNGPSTAHSILLTNILPLNATFISATSSVATCTQANGIVTCTLAELLSGQTASVTATVHPQSLGTYTNLFTVSTEDFDPVSSNNTLIATTVVQEPPSISVQPESQTATNGDTVILSVGASGTALRYQWTLSGTNLVNATNSSLVLSNVQSSQSGNYAVKVSNLVGEVTSDVAVVNILGPASIITQPQSQSIILGNSVTFSVVAGGTEPFTYQWFFNGGMMSGQTASSSQIASVQISDEGDYRVRVQNSAGTVWSDSAHLTVLIPPSITQPPQSSTNIAGRGVVLSVEAAGTTPFAYLWLFNGNALALATNSSLTLSNLHKSDSGLYAVAITNAGGAITSSPAILTVLEMDFGDAAAIGYPTVLAFNGARHVIVPGVRLGAQIDYEPDGQPNSNATGDDLACPVPVGPCLNDDDGVLFLQSWYVGQTIQIGVIASTNGLLNAWVDFNQNGSWLDVGDQIFADQPVVAGTNLLSLSLPGSALTGPTFARFRFSTAGGLADEGEAPDGEVEDYRVNLMPAADLEVQVRDAVNPVILGSNAVYTISVSNHGPSSATTMLLRDVLPATTTYVSAEASQGSCVLSNGTVWCDLGTLPLAQEAIVTLIVQPTRTGLITNTATVTAAEYDAPASNNTSTKITAVVLPVQSFANPARIDINDLGTAQTYPSTILVSGLTASVYKVSVALSNINHSFPDDLDILLVGPGGQSVMLISDAGGGTLIDAVTLRFDDDAGLILPDNSGFISGTFKPANYDNTYDPLPAPAPAPPYGNHLAVFEGTDPNGFWSLYAVDDAVDDVGFINDGWSIEITTINPLADVGVSVVDLPHEVILGSNLTYSITVTNHGPGWATSIGLHDVLPTNVNLLSVTSAGNACSNSVGTIDCSWAEIAPGSSKIVTALVRAPQLGTISNYVAVTSYERDLNQANNAASTLSFCKVPTDLAISATSSPEPVSISGTVSYTLSVSNKGPNQASAIVVSDELPASVQFINATASQGTCSQNAGVVTCQLGNLPVGGTAAVSISASAMTISIMTNVAAVSSYEIDLQPPDNRVVLPTRVALFSRLTSAQAITVPANSAAVPYPSTISVSGLTSAVHAVSVTLSNLQTVWPEKLDLLLVGPHGERALLMSDAGGSNAVAGTTIRFDDRASLSLPDEQAIVAGSFRPTNYVNGNEAFSAPAPTGPFTARLGVFADTDPNGVWSLFIMDRQTNHAASSIASWTLSLETIVPIADLQVFAAARPNPVAAASNLTYTVTVSNAGPAIASGIVLSNALGAGQLLISVVASQGSCTADSFGVVCGLGELAAHASTSIDVTVTPMAAGLITNMAVVLGLQRDLVISNNTLIYNVVIEDAPAIVENPVSIVRTNGDSAIFNVAVSGTAPLAYQWRRNGTNMVAATTSQLVLSNVTLADAGSYEVQISNRVGGVLSAPASLTVRMRPVIGAIGPQSTPEDVAKSIPFVIGDFETPAGALQVVVRSSDTVLIPAGGISLSGSGSNRVLNILPATNLFGVATISIVVTDSDGISETNNFLLTVTSVNDLPVISAIGSQATPEDTVKVVNFTVGDVETAAGALNVSVAAGDSNLASGLALGGTGANRTLTITPKADQFGSTLITLTVTDADAGTVSTNFVLTVNPVNDLPTLNTISDLVINEDSGSRTVNLAGVTSGASNELQTLTVTAVSSDPAIIPNPTVDYTSPSVAGTLTFTPVTNATGSATVTVTVNDGGASNNITTRTFQVTVNPINDTPTILATSDQAIDEDTAASIAIVVGDVEGVTNLIVTGSSSNTGLVSSAGISITGTASNRAVTITPLLNQFGSTIITLVVRDPEGASASNSFNLAVRPVNDFPTLNALSDLVINEDAGQQTVPLTGISSGAADENQLLSVTVSNSNPALLSGVTVSYSSPSNSGTLSFGTLSNAFGVAVLTVTVTDDGSSNNVISRNFHVTVNSVNDLPVLSQIPPQTVAEDTAAGPLAISGGDLETAADSLTLSGISSNPALLPDQNISFAGTGSNRFVTVTPATNQNGTTIVTIVLHDADGGAVSNSFLLTVNAVNDMPAISSIATQVTDEDVAHVVSFTISDAETPAENLTISATSTDTNLVPNGALLLGGSASSRTVTIQPATNQFGNTTITLTVRDAEGVTASSSFLLTVNSVNDLPTIDPITDQVTTEDVSKTVAVRIGDLETAAPALSLQGLSTNTVLVPNGNISFSGTGSNRLVTISPATNQIGVTRITLIVTDAGGGSASNSFNLTVTNVNDAPTISAIADLGIDEDATAGPISFTIFDAENVAGVVVTGSSANAGLVPNTNIVISGSASNRTVTLTPTPNQSGSSVVTLTAIDAQGASASTTFKVTVNPINDAPSITAPTNQVIVEDGSTAALPFVVSDVETPASNLVVTARSSNLQLLGESGIVLGGTGSDRTVRLTPTTNQFGSATVVLSVRDADEPFQTASSSFVLTVTASNDPPSLAAITDQTIGEDNVLSVALSVTDLDTAAANLTFSATSSNLVLVPNGNIVFTGSDWVRNLQITPAANQSGNAAITVTVSDGIASATRNFLLTVTAVNDPPTLNPISNVSISEDAGPQTVPLSGISAGATNESQALTLTAISSNPALIPNPTVNYTSPNTSGSLNFTAPTNGNGAAVITVTVDDGQSIFARNFTVTVNASNDLPTISALTNQTVVEDTKVTAAFIVNDLETPPYLLTVSANSSNTALVAISNIVVHGNGTNRTAVITPTANAFGTTLITLSVNDGQGSTSSSFLLTVNPVNDQPTLDLLNDQNLTAPGGNGTVSQTINLTGISSGATNESQTLTITATSSATTVFATPTVTYTSPNATGTLTITSVRGATGNSIITVTVNDGGASNNAVVRTFVARLKASGNANPTISMTASTNINEDTVAGPIPFTIGDSSTAVTLLTVTARSLNPALVPDTNIVIGGSASNRTVTVTPVANASGTATVQVTVTDNAFGSITSNLVVNVSPINDAAAISAIAPQTISEDTPTAVLGFAVSDVETPASSLILSAASSNPALVSTNNIQFGGSGTNRALVITPATNQFGTSTITLTVSDGTTNSSTSFLLTVNAVSDPPTIAPIADQTINEDTPSAPIALTIGDGETAAASLTLSATSSVPALIASFNFGGSDSNRTLVITPASNQSGIATVTVKVSDTDGSSSTTSFLLTVNTSNDSPTLDAINNITINEDAGVQTVNLSGISAGDAESQTLAVTAISSNPDVVPNPIVTHTSPNTTGSLSFTPVRGTNGTSLITVTVNDGQTNTFARTFTVTVNDRPSISFIADQTSPEDAVIGPLAFTVTDRDTSANNLVVTGTSSNPGLIPDGNILVTGTSTNRTVLLTPLPNQFGGATITLSTTDSNNLVGSRSFAVVVASINDAPGLNALTDMVINENAGVQTVALSGISSGAANENQVLSVTASSSNPELLSPPMVTYTSPSVSGSLSFAPAADRNGSATITVSVNDGGTLNTVRSRSFTVTVNAVNNAPTLDPIPDLPLGTNAGPQTVGLSGISAGNFETQPLSITAFSSDPGFIPHPVVTYSNPNSYGYLTFTPVANSGGSAIITVTVNDSAASNNLFSRTFHVAIGRPLNAPAILSISRVGSRIDVLFSTESGFHYTLESKTDLNASLWETISGGTGTGSPITLSHSAPVEATRFYRIRVD